MEMSRKRDKKIYLVIDPSMEEPVLLDRIAQALEEKIAALQIWDNFRPDQEISRLAERICRLCQNKNVPVYMNNRWQVLENVPLDGVHFDEIPPNIEEIRNKVGRHFLTGLTCNNNLGKVEWAENNHFDYISFCSMFPSSTSNSCEPVNFETITRAKEKYSLPIYLAGGIHVKNIDRLNSLDYEGIAVISGIMNKKETRKSIREYREKLNF
jgi:thiamine-phosphate pyrophosphorylase